ncbi:hypothetical protein Tco_0331780 [Tanacetum coccineum]
MTEFTTRVRQDTNEIYTRLDDEQSERQLMAGRLNICNRDLTYTCTYCLGSWRSEDQAQDAVITELQATDRRRQAAITEMLAVDREETNEHVP